MTTPIPVIVIPTLSTSMDGFSAPGVDLAPGFRVTATAPGGIIEGMESVSGSPVIGVQWHLEAMTEHHPEMLSLFLAWRDEVRAASGIRRNDINGYTA